ncbi:ATP-binding protein [Kitasatospora sp. GP82]|uniref:ATP-binding protein n=1 Tax=Kitasatospora sp. GP82 TaxID=3035089 RepID=UPI0024761C8A|nr:ATP-binding protein [Kitasatospora sp. GP82]MDH6127423.1 serine/threonine-protein kinase RsbW [Kitasatospora sp. GP82]
MTEVMFGSAEVTAVRQVWLSRHRKSAGSARRLLRDFLAGLGGGEPYGFVGELVVCELVTNAVQHARTSPGRLILVRFELLCDVLRIEVHDASSKLPTVCPPSGADQEAGRGLWLVEQLSARWGCGPREGGIGKLVWAEVAAAPGARGE